MAETISLAQLKAAFGTYVGTNQKDILRLLTQPTYSETFMTTKQSHWITLASRVPCKSVR